MSLPLGPARGASATSWTSLAPTNASMLQPKPAQRAGATYHRPCRRRSGAGGCNWDQPEGLVQRFRSMAYGWIYGTLQLEPARRAGATVSLAPVPGSAWVTLQLEPALGDWCNPVDVLPADRDENATTGTRPSGLVQRTPYTERHGRSSRLLPLEPALMGWCNQGWGYVITGDSTPLPLEPGLEHW